MRLRTVWLAVAALGVAGLGYVLGRLQTPSPPVRDAADGMMAAQARGHAAATRVDAPHAATRPGGLPARGLPLRRVLPELQARATAGDVAAARRIYSDLGACRRLDGMEQTFDGIADEVLATAPDAADASGVAAYALQLDAIESRRRNLQRFRDLCAGIERDTLDLQVPALRQAARLGDEDARACYLAHGPTYDAAALIRHPEWLPAYRSSVASLIDAGLTAGDWKVVDIVGRAYEPGADSPLAGSLGVDPAMHYRYLTLFRLGADADRAAPTDRRMRLAAARLSPEQRVDAERWAQATMDRHFGRGRSTTATVPGWDPCAFTFDPW